MLSFLTRGEKDEMGVENVLSWSISLKKKEESTIELRTCDLFIILPDANNILKLAHPL